MIGPHKSLLLRYEHAHFISSLAPLPITESWLRPWLSMPSCRLRPERTVLPFELIRVKRLMVGGL